MKIRHPSKSGIGLAFLVLSLSQWFGSVRFGSVCSRGNGVDCSCCCCCCWFYFSTDKYILRTKSLLLTAPFSIFIFVRSLPLLGLYSFFLSVCRLNTPQKTTFIFTSYSKRLSAAAKYLHSNVLLSSHLLHPPSGCCRHCLELILDASLFLTEIFMFRLTVSMFIWYFFSSHIFSSASSFFSQTNFRHFLWFYCFFFFKSIYGHLQWNTSAMGCFAKRELAMPLSEIHQFWCSNICFVSACVLKTHNKYIASIV